MFLLKIFVSLDLLTKVITTMEVPKLKKLCTEVNQMGVKHLIFTLDNVSLKTFGDSDSVKILGEGQEIQHLVEQVLRRANPVFFLSAYQSQRE